MLTKVDASKSERAETSEQVFRQKKVARNKNSFNFMTKTKHKLGERESEKKSE